MEIVSARRDVALVMAEHCLSDRQACRLLELDRTTYRYEARPDANEKLREALVTLARQKPRYGYRRLWGDPDAPRLGREREAHLPAVSPGGPHGSAAEAQTRGA